MLRSYPRFCAVMAVIFISANALLLLLNATHALAETATRFDILTHSALLTYQDTDYKQSGKTGGVYGYFGYGARLAIEGEVDFVRINFAGGTVSDQWDYTLLGTVYPKTGWIARTGLHWIQSSDNQTDNAWSVLAGLTYYQPYRWNLLLDGAYSQYQSFEPAFNAWQLNPGVGRTFGRRLHSSFYGEARIYWIHLSEDIGLADGAQNFYSLETQLSYYYKKWTFNSAVWLGEQAFAVRNGGMILYNVAEKHRGGLSGFVHLAVTPSWGLKATGQIERFNEPNGQSNALAVKIGLAVGHTF